MSAWLEHVKKTMSENAGKPLKEVLKIAKKTYKSVTGEKKVHKSKRKVNKHKARKTHKKSRKSRKSRK